MKGCVASGYPFILGFSVYESFETVAGSGHAQMPKPTETLLGGHAAIAVGYEDDRQWFLNDYLLNANLSDDFWTIRLVQ